MRTLIGRPQHPLASSFVSSSIHFHPKYSSCFLFSSLFSDMTNTAFKAFTDIHLLRYLLLPGGWCCRLFFYFTWAACLLLVIQPHCVNNHFVNSIRALTPRIHQPTTELFANRRLYLCLTWNNYYEMMTFNRYRWMEPLFLLSLVRRLWMVGEPNVKQHRLCQRHMIHPIQLLMSKQMALCRGCWDKNRHDSYWLFSHWQCAIKPAFPQDLLMLMKMHTHSWMEMFAGANTDAIKTYAASSYHRKCANIDWIWGQYFRLGCSFSELSFDKSVAPKNRQTTQCGHVPRTTTWFF